ncbi:SRPBCC family protein [Pseudaestuariivita atlantica]|uniref:DNA polymerase III subunit gamma/tau n=1 Tax=Pseudaestuariivita atlantica TaxID=1317121 RepID=A0A0L1JRA6_9RHOB|nr:SRPBCC family protein [Pseudaestuariivita atlantica]KNG94271.1 DNA polymerase III subunit gamma/tau [Pseudaestuariivita atlantica]
MNFLAKEDIEAPIDQVFGMLTDFDAIERAALWRGIDVKRQAGPVAVGLTWDLKFTFRGKDRAAHLKLTEFDAPNGVAFDSDSGGIEAEGRIDLVALSRSRTRMTTHVELEAKTLSARLLLQSLKLAKSNLNKRFKLRLANFAKEIETRCAKRA